MDEKEMGYGHRSHLINLRIEEKTYLDQRFPVCGTHTNYGGTTRSHGDIRENYIITRKINYQWYETNS